MMREFPQILVLEFLIVMEITDMGVEFLTFTT